MAKSSHVLKTGRRYKSNIAIVEDLHDLAGLPEDVLEGRLANFQSEGLFTGADNGPKQREFDDNFQEKLARLFSSAATPRLAGVQIKAPMCLRENGELIVAVNAPFTHILKPVGTNGFEHLPIFEWIGLSFARAVGFEVPEAALVPMPGGMTPALLVERFDVRRSGTIAVGWLWRISARSWSFLQKENTGDYRADGKGPAAVVDLTGGGSENSISSSIVCMVHRRRRHAFEELGHVEGSGEGEDQFTSVRFATVYDAVTTRVFPSLETDHMALKLNSRDDRLSPEDFMTLARTSEFSLRWASDAMARFCAQHDGCVW